jgi:hypothetical protein
MQSRGPTCIRLPQYCEPGRAGADFTGLGNLEFPSWVPFQKNYRYCGGASVLYSRESA